MDRLTKRNEDGVVSMAVNCPNGCEYYTCNIDEGPQCNHQCEADIVCKLAEYEDAEENGLLLRLPCPIGTKVYFINYHEDDDFGHYEVASGTFNYSWLDFPRKFYLTKEEAEKALKQMEEKE